MGKGTKITNSPGVHPVVRDEKDSSGSDIITASRKGTSIGKFMVVKISKVAAPINRGKRARESGFYKFPTSVSTPAFDRYVTETRFWDFVGGGNGENFDRSVLSRCDIACSSS